MCIAHDRPPHVFTLKRGGLKGNEQIQIDCRSDGDTNQGSQTGMWGCEEDDFGTQVFEEPSENIR